MTILIIYKKVFARWRYNIKSLRILCWSNGMGEPLERYMTGIHIFKTMSKQNGLCWSLGKAHAWFSFAFAFLQGFIALICLTFLTSNCVCVTCSSQLTLIAGDGLLHVFKGWRLFSKVIGAFLHGTLQIPLHFLGKHWWNRRLSGSLQLSQLFIF